jgi:hypothetical protein
MARMRLKSTAWAHVRKPGQTFSRLLGVFRLTTNSNPVGWSTGSSAGFAPLRIRPA